MRQISFVAPLLVLIVLVPACGNSPHSVPSTGHTDAGLDSGSRGSGFDASVLDSAAVATTTTDGSTADTAGQGGSDSPLETMDSGHGADANGGGMTGSGGMAGSFTPAAGTGGDPGSWEMAGAGGSAAIPSGGGGGMGGAGGMQGAAGSNDSGPQAGSGAGGGGSGGASSAGFGGSVAAGSGGAGSGGAGSGGSLGTAGSGGSGASVCSGPPGLYADQQCTVLAPGIRVYAPRFPLWSDGSVKTRYVYLPPGATIDASQADHWQFPVGTKFYKEFRSPDATLRIETRVMEKLSDSNSSSAWNYDTYVWSADQKSVHVEVNGVTNALGSGLDVPARALCTSCHNHSDYPRDMVNGFQAIQLNWSGAQVSLQTLISEAKLANYRSDIVSAAVIPGRNATETSAFGYLHGNCGHCHTLNEDAPHYMTLLTAVGVPLANQLAWTTTVCVFPHTATESYATQRIAVGTPSNSAVYNRASVRGHQRPAANPVDAGAALDGPSDSMQMPPMATNVVDNAAMAVQAQWITNLAGCTP
jgi:hypothetical protein